MDADSLIPSVATISPMFAEHFLAQTKAVILDVRDATEFAKGHIKGAISVPLHAIESASEVAEIPKEQPIIVYDQTGHFGAQATALLKNQGFINVYNLAGGLTAWQYINLPLTTT